MMQQFLSVYFKKRNTFSEKTCMTDKINNKNINFLTKMKYKKTKSNAFAIKREVYDDEDSRDYQITQNTSFKCSKRAVVKNALPQIVIKKKLNDSSTSTQDEILLLNGNWDTSHTIPNIVAEMHNVKLEELQSTWVGDTGDSFFADSNDPLKLYSDEFNHPVSSPRGSDSGLGNDSPEGNLSWLLNFKLDEIPGLPDYSLQSPPKRCTPRKNLETQNKISPIYVDETIPKEYFDQHKVQDVNVARFVNEQQYTSSSGTNEECGSTGKLTVQNNTNRYSGPRKPPFTYTELIEHALREKGELTVSGIYNWISDHFSFFKANDDRWKNSVRHNLSINPHFRKGSKAIHGAGHLWTIAQKDDIQNTTSWNVKRQRMQHFMQTAAKEWHQQELELATATASILPDMENCEKITQTTDAQQSQMQQAANEILGGMKKEVEVQYIIPINTMDFMCPVSKEQVAEECGLANEEIHVTGNDYLITDLNPTTLGLTLTEAEIITTDQLFSDDLNFHCYELSTEHN